VSTGEQIPTLGLLRFHILSSSVEERWKFVSRYSFVTSAPRQRPWHHWSKIVPLRYYANCVSTTLTVLIRHNVERVYFVYSNPINNNDFLKISWNENIQSADKHQFLNVEAAGFKGWLTPTCVTEGNVCLTQPTEGATPLVHLTTHRTDTVSTAFLCTVRSESRCVLIKGVGSDVHEPQWVNLN
jgi:hypothetical protein